MEKKAIQFLTKEYVKTLLKPRDPTANKGDFGHSLIVAGNIGKMGAAVIAAKGCLRSGTGLLTVNVPKAERAILQVAIPEAMLSFRNGKFEGSKISAIGIGSGMGVGKESKKKLCEILEDFKGPMLLDADALNILGANKKLFKKLRKGMVITPHPKEFDNMFGMHVNETERRKAAMRLAVEHQLVIVLKGHQTLVTSKDGSFLNNTGNVGLAKGGSGDALGGIITALLAQGYQPFVAAQLGVYLHGLAADIALSEQSLESMLISDVIDCIGKAFNNVIS